MKENLIARDLETLWHPCSQMKDYETLSPIIIKSARGSYLELEDGKLIIDAISSWWCKSLGHRHPKLSATLHAQLEKFEHVILANTTHPVIVELSEKLTQLTNNLKKVFYASDGSSAVEIAIKMSLHSRQLMEQRQKTKFIALANGYHGETLGALSVSDLGMYKQPYQHLLFPVQFIQPIPYVNNKEDPLWKDCSEYWQLVEPSLQLAAETTTALILEPIVQGAGGMKIYSQDFLFRIRHWTQQNNIHLIADEIMTGIGRTGKALACEHANVEADFVCLSKGLTGGYLPLSAVLTSNAIFNLFYDDYPTGKAFLHSHTFSGNALAASVALRCLEIMSEENIYQQVQQRENFLRELMNEAAEATNKLKNIRHIGNIVAADLVVKNPDDRVGFAVFKEALKLGAFLRPLGNTLYWAPPLNITNSTLLKLRDITIKAINSI